MILTLRLGDKEDLHWAQNAVTQYHYLHRKVDWRIIAASVVAIGLSETADTEVYQRLLDRHWLVRVAGSNSVSIPLDSVVFNAVAFAGVFTWPVLAAIVFGEIVVKFIAGALVALWRHSK